MKEEQDLKDKFYELNKEQIKLFEDLQKQNEQLKVEILSLKNSGSALEVNGKFGINNLAKLNSEAIFDAIKHFNKSCPYCKTDLYSGHLRNNYEIDHFFPIAKGGQDVPWNLLPICRNCNRKKRDKWPFEYLDEDTFNECKTYLQKIQFNITQNHEDRLLRDELIQNLVINLFSNKILIDDFIEKLYVLYNLKEKAEDIDKKQKVDQIFDKERLDTCTNSFYFSISNIMKFQDVKDMGLTRSFVKETLIKLYGVPDKSQRFYKRNRK